VAQAFGLDLNEYPWVVKIAGHLHPVYVSPPTSHFPNVNILGQDFSSLNRLRPWVDDELGLVTYYIGKNCWEKPKPKPKL
jgi:hypothetical protein